MKHKKITIATSIYNEGENILNFLSSISKQKITKFKIVEFLIISDGSTDDTNEKVESFISKFPIRFVKGKKRIGKSQRLNEIFQMAKGDYIVLLDGDIYIPNENTIRVLLSKVNKNVDLIAGSSKPLPYNNLVERAVNASVELYYQARINVKNGSNPHCCIGRVMVISGELAKQTVLPRKTIGNDAYIYFSCVSKNYNFVFNPNAVVYYRSPNTLKDHAKQLTRYESVSTWMSGYFGSDLVKREYEIPRVQFMKSFIRVLLNDPIGLISIMLLNSYIRIMYRKKKMNALWSVSNSSKKVIVPSVR